MAQEEMEAESLPDSLLPPRRDDPNNADQINQALKSGKTRPRPHILPTTLSAGAIRTPFPVIPHAGRR